MSVSVQIKGTSDVLKGLNKVEKILRIAITDAVQDAAAFVKRESAQQVPLDKGTLLKSGEIQTISKGKAGIKLGVSYNTPYAKRWHYERARFQHGRKTHYLSDPMKEAVGKFPVYMIRSIKRVI